MVFHVSTDINGIEIEIYFFGDRISTGFLSTIEYVGHRILGVAFCAIDSNAALLMYPSLND